MKALKRFSTYFKMLVVALAIVGLVIPQSAEAAAAKQIREAQTIMTKFGLPTGPVDGLMGPQTQRGLCAFRYISGMTVTRSSKIDAKTLKTLREYNKKYKSLKQVSDRKSYNGEYMVAQKTCQVLFHINKGKFNKAMAMSSGIKTRAGGIETPNKPRYSNQKYYTLGNTVRGWHCSNQFPESCRHEKAGRFANMSSYGNMYNIRSMNDGGLFVHGSTRVPTFPGSAGCIRVTTKDSDWMWDHVGNKGSIHLYVEGRYNWSH